MFSSEVDWFIIIESSSTFWGLFEVDFDVEDYSQRMGAVGIVSQPVGLLKTIARDFNKDTNTFTYIEEDRKIGQINIQARKVNDELIDFREQD